MLDFLHPVEHFGRKFDRGMVLFEFDALREPEKTRFPQIGAWLRERVPMVEAPTPSMLWRKRICPDLYIANQLEALRDTDCGTQGHLQGTGCHLTIEGGDVSFEFVSRFQHGDSFHETFIEPMCRKITGRPSREIAAKYHRAIWLPLYWPQTLRARASIRTPFYYPTAGYAGNALACLSGTPEYSGKSATWHNNDSQTDSISISLAFVVAAPRRTFSVLFVVDDSPIYRITDMDACAGIDAPEHRLIVEYRGECNVPLELERLILAHYPQKVAYDSIKFTLPTIKNVLAGWKPRPTINDQLWSIINAKD